MTVKDSAIFMQDKNVCIFIEKNVREFIHTIYIADLVALITIDDSDKNV